MRYLFAVGHMGVALLWRKPETLALGEKTLNDNCHTSKGLSVHHRQRLSKAASPCLIDCPILSLMMFTALKESVGMP